MDTSTESNSQTVENSGKGKRTRFRTALISLILLVAAGVWIQSGAYRVHYETVLAWFSSFSDEEDLEVYEFPPFDEEKWRQVLATAAKDYRANRKLTREKDSHFQWVSTASGPKTSLAASSSNPHAGSDSGERSEFWSFQNLTHQAVPEFPQDPWIRNPIDAFVLAKMQEQGLKPGPEADQWTLARRIWLDLNGLPPTPGELQEFVNSQQPDQYAATVESLMSRKEFGEHWATFWLDLARYSDSNGYELDELKPYAFPYRDFVIWAMNEDVAFDEFIRWQIAGDLIEPENPMAVAATGFFTNAPINNFLPQESERYDELADQVSTYGRAMLGLTIGCARCHDHFYDPITHVEYHGLVAILKDTKREKKYLVPDQGSEYLESGGREYEAAKAEITQILIEAVKEQNISELDFTEEEKDLLRRPIDPDNEEQALLLSKCMRCLMVYEEDITDDLIPRRQDRKRYNKLVLRVKELEPGLASLPPLGLTLSGDAISEMPILKGGKPDQAGRTVGPGFLSELTTGKPEFDSDHWKRWSDSPRKALAFWTTDLENGAGALVARVIVNRLWQHHFGRGLVTTPSDFGSLGDLPSHPELLEWLAAELVRNDWSLKHIHRLIVHSSTYRQATQPASDGAEIDPLNKWYSRQNQFRVPAEVMRDSILLASGTLNDLPYGRPVFPEIPPDAIYSTQASDEYVWPLNTSDEDDRLRRTVYLVKKRTIPIPFLNLFDQPDGSFSCEKRSRSIVPTQALSMMNSPFLKKNTIALANRLLEKSQDRTSIVTEAFLAILSRQPSPEELTTCLEFFEEPSSQPVSPARVIDLCHTLFMTNEFIYRN